MCCFCIARSTPFIVYKEDISCGVLALLDLHLSKFTKRTLGVVFWHCWIYTFLKRNIGWEMVHQDFPTLNELTTVILTKATISLIGQHSCLTNGIIKLYTVTSILYHMKWFVSLCLLCQYYLESENVYFNI